MQRIGNAVVLTGANGYDPGYGNECYVDPDSVAAVIPHQVNRNVTGARLVLRGAPDLFVRETAREVAKAVFGGDHETD